MQYQSVLLTIIEVAAVFFGFIIVFLTFVMSGKDQSKADRMHGRALIAGAFPLIIVPFVPLVVDAYGGSEAMAWRATPHWWSPFKHDRWRDHGLV